MKFRSLALVLTILLVTLFGQLAKCEDCFRAGVYQHLQLIKYKNQSFSDITQRNLDVFEEIASKASEEGVKILVFPEDGIINAQPPRSKNYEIAEHIPDPLRGHFNPCESPDDYKDRIKTYRLSCLAKTYELYIVANYGDRVNCEKAIDPKCPDDGHYLFNTAVVFAPNGSLVAKYHKMQLFHELYYNVPPKPEFVFFDTPFGRMGLFICFDIIFRNPGIELISKYGVQTMLFPTWWYDEVPYRTAVQIQQEWALTNNVNLLASNRHQREIGSAGSGIFSGQSGQMISSDIDEKSPHLLIADLPIDSRNTGAKCLSNRFNKTIVNTKFVDKLEYKPLANMVVNNSALYQLKDDQESVRLCHKGLCCQLDYELGSANKFKDELFWFFVANRTGNDMRDSHYPVCEEICGLFRCEDQNCHKFSIETKEIVFKNLQISGEFSTKYVYPSATTNRLKLIPTTYWSYENNGKIGSELKLSLKNYHEPLLSSVLYGRCYDKDPPYKQ